MKKIQLVIGLSLAIVLVVGFVGASALTMPNQPNGLITQRKQNDAQLPQLITSRTTGMDSSLLASGATIRTITFPLGGLGIAHVIAFIDIPIKKVGTNVGIATVTLLVNGYNAGHASINGDALSTDITWTQFTFSPMVGIGGCNDNYNLDIQLSAPNAAQGSGVAWGYNSVDHYLLYDVWGTTIFYTC